MKRFIQYIAMILLVAGLGACGKDFLDLKPQKKQRIPSTIADFQAITDYSEYSMNTSSSHDLGVIGSDEYTISDLKYDTFPVQSTAGLIGYQKKAYVWASEIYVGGEVSDWQSGYARILRTNIAIDGLSKIGPTVVEQSAWNNAKGCAMFHRALNYYNLTQLYCAAYNASTANNDSGLPLRINTDVTENVQRGSLQSTYNLILSDLENAKELLPDEAITIFRPGKTAVFALLARVYLQMSDYKKAEQNADECLKRKDQLMDLNTMNMDLRYPFAANGMGNPEVLFMNQMNSTTIFNQAGTYFNAAKTLFDSYKLNDLRRKGYWFLNKDDRILFKGSFTGNAYLFSGLAIDEMYLVRAECRARLDKMGSALDDLNHLLKYRYDKNSFVPVVSDNKIELLNLIFSERTKELVLRGIRWEDLRRLNKEKDFATILYRVINGKRYELEPNDKRYLWPLPLEAIALGGYKQNIR